jgi:activated CDC42 kinase 1
MASNFSEEDDTQWLRDILTECQLEQFYSSIKDELQISRLSHFDYVHADDLLKVGLSKPRARQLLDVVKRKKTHQWRKNIIAKLIGKQHSNSSSSKGENSKTTVSKYNDSIENNFTCLIHEKDLKLLDKLGDGSFGVVKRGEWTKSKENSLEVAVKILKVDTQTPHSFEDFFKEVQSMHALHHPNLIQLFGIVLSQPMMMVTELAENGALLDYLRKHNRNISLSLLWNFIVQISTGMAYLESKRFLHRDLACRNVLIAKGNKIKIADFGLMRALPQQDEIYVMTEPKKVNKLDFNLIRISSIINEFI